MTFLTYLDKQLHIFDYDFTLYLDWSCDEFYRTYYKNYVMEKIKTLKSEGKLIAMASHNQSAREYIKRSYNDIYNCFDFFVCEYPMAKDIMVSMILEQLQCKPEEAIFYDDVKSNIDIVQKLGVTSYLVNDRRGIVFDEIKIDTTTQLIHKD